MSQQKIKLEWGSTETGLVEKSFFERVSCSSLYKNKLSEKISEKNG